MSRRSPLAALFLLLTAAAAQADFVTSPASSYGTLTNAGTGIPTFDGTRAEVNRGAVPQESAVIKFALNGVIPRGATIISAVLTLGFDLSTPLAGSSAVGFTLAEYPSGVATSSAADFTSITTRFATGSVAGGSSAAPQQFDVAAAIREAQGVSFGNAIGFRFDSTGGTIRFNVPHNPPAAFEPSLVIQFSPAAVPEPGSLALLATAGAAAGAGALRRRAA